MRTREVGVTMTHISLHRSFMTALLLTGSPHPAEAAVLKGIDSLDPDSMTDERLFQGTIAASMLATSGQRSVEELEKASAMLPGARCVLRLSVELRYSYVLRVLAGLSAELCTRLLGVDMYKIDHLVWSAATLLMRRD